MLTLLLLIILLQQLLHLSLIKILLSLAQLFDFPSSLPGSTHLLILQLCYNPLKGSLFLEMHFFLCETFVLFEGLSKVIVAYNHRALDFEFVESLGFFYS